MWFPSRSETCETKAWQSLNLPEWEFGCHSLEGQTSRFSALYKYTPWSRNSCGWVKKHTRAQDASCVNVYNSSMNRVDVNDQYRSYYPPGTTSRKWWKYLLWFFDLSIVNAFILEKLGGSNRRQLTFHRELARLLIAGYNGYKRLSSSGYRAIRTVTTEENLKGHHLGKCQSRKRVCAMWKKAPRRPYLWN